MKSWKQTFSAVFIWIFVVQTLIGFSSYASGTSTGPQVALAEVVARYNTFASSPIGRFPIKLSPKDEAAMRAYMKIHKVKVALPKARVTASGAIEMTMDGQKTTVEILDLRGVVRINGKVLVLRRSGGASAELRAIEKIVSQSKSASAAPSGFFVSVLESLLNFIEPNANADCLDKYDAKIQRIYDRINTENPYTQGLYSYKHPSEIVFGIGLLLAMLLPYPLSQIGAYAAFGGSWYVNEKALAYRYKSADYVAEHSKEGSEFKQAEEAIEAVESDAYKAPRYEKLEQDASAAAAQGRKTEASELLEQARKSRAEAESNQSDLTLRGSFNLLYLVYGQESKKAGIAPLSRDAFAKSLLDGDRDGSICDPEPLATAALGTALARKFRLDPNGLTQSLQPQAPQGKTNATTDKKSRAEAPGSQEDRDAGAVLGN